MAKAFPNAMCDRVRTVTHQKGSQYSPQHCKQTNQTNHQCIHRKPVHRITPQTPVLMTKLNRQTTAIHSRPIPSTSAHYATLSTPPRNFRTLVISSSPFSDSTALVKPSSSVSTSPSGCRVHSETRCLYLSSTSRLRPFRPETALLVSLDLVRTAFILARRTAVEGREMDAGSDPFLAASMAMSSSFSH